MTRAKKQWKKSCEGVRKTKTDTFGWKGNSFFQRRISVCPSVSQEGKRERSIGQEI